MRDFTPETYKLLLTSLLDKKYSFLPFVDFLRNPETKSIILRHDVDARKMNSLKTAQLENELGIKGTYYFRIVPESFDAEVIKQIYDLGHEVGYHYEDVSLTAQRRKGLEAQRPERNLLLGEPVPLKREARGGFKVRIMKANTIIQEKELCNVAIDSFRENLEKLRRVVPIETICMHGSPLSRWDNRLLWKYYDYRDFSIVGEPYFDIDFEKILYLTDTGRRWDGVSIRDKVAGRGGLRDEETERRRDRKEGGGDEGGEREGRRDEETEGRRDKSERGGEEEKGLEGRRDGGTERRRDKETEGLRAQGSELRAQGKAGLRNKDQSATCNLQPATLYKFHSTIDIIAAARENRLPDQIMLTVHPQRWDDRPLHWVRELVWQNVKNTVKRWVVRKPWV